MTFIINVQFMRAVAALAVLIYHFSIQLIAAGGSSDHWFYYVFNQIGYAGVDFFFVISGYIMWVTTQKVNDQHPVLNFAYKRATRIYFGYWPYFLIALLVVTLMPQLLSAQTNLLGSFFLTELNTTSLLIQVAWTLQYELYFYSLFALLLMFSKNQALKIISGLAVVIIANQVFSHWQPLLSVHELAPRLFNFFLSPFCLEFFAGVLLARYFQSHRLKFMSLTALVGVALLGLAIYLQEYTLKTTLTAGNHLNLRVAVFGTSAVLLMAVVIEAEMRGRLLFEKVSTLLGGASYSIYLSHTIVIALVFALGIQNWLLNNSQYPGVWVFAIMCLTVIYSIIHYIYVEQPLMRAAKRLQHKLF